VYAFPELSPNGAQAVAQAKRIAVPGCHASGFIALIAPLVQAKLLSAQALLTCHSVTGYSGGGKAMIEAYTAPNAPAAYDAPRLYGLSQQHKHLREMQAYSGLEQPPVFCPVVAPFYSGMLVTVGLFAAQLAPGAHRFDVIQAYCAAYQGDVVRYVPTMDEDGFIAANALSGSDRMEITVLGNDERLVLAARYDNLGKGASGAAVQAMNLVLGAPPTTGLVL
jgi:N-acetyl-gamma-glutamyl-phosphate reductase